MPRQVDGPELEAPEEQDVGCESCEVGDTSAAQDQGDPEEGVCDDSEEVSGCCEKTANDGRRWCDLGETARVCGEADTCLYTGLADTSPEPGLSDDSLEHGLEYTSNWTEFGLGVMFLWLGWKVNLIGDGNAL